MKFSVRALAIGISAFTLVSISSAAAHPITITDDHTDNVYSFDYDSKTGEIPSESSYRKTVADDDVTFTVVVRETGDGGSGLIGRLKLRLNGDHRTIYKGWITLHVADAEGTTAYQKAKPVSIQLYPKPGMRRASVPFRFDIPSGSYQATGSFATD